MFRKSYIGSILFLLISAFTAQAAVHEVKGVVVALRPDIQVAVIRHDAIPGVMPAMTMPFAVRAAEDFEKLSVNHEVRFEFVMESTGSHARAFEVLGKVEESSTQPAPRSGSSSAEKVEEGSTVPAVELIDQDGKSTALRDDSGRFTLMTFIFTRCPVPDFCPLMSSNFQDLHRRFSEAGVLEKMRLLSVTIDPENDSPAVLHNYGKGLGADFGNWTFATADEAVIDRVASAFRVYREQNGATLDHTLCTALIDPEGTVLEIWRGNRWKIENVFERSIDAVEAR